MPNKKFFKDPIINSSNVRTPGNKMGLIEAISIISEGRFLQTRVNKHHEIYNCPIKGTTTENVFVNVFSEDLGLGELVNDILFDWVPESHKPGADLTIPSLETSGISVKCGQIKKIGRKKRATDIREDHRITFSSYRLTGHLEWQDKLNFMSQRHHDITFLLSPHMEYGKYYWAVLENLDFKALEWSEVYSEESGKHTGWRGMGGEQGIIKANVNNTLAAQLWIEARLSSNRIIHFEEICLD